MRPASALPCPPREAPPALARPSPRPAKAPVRVVVVSDAAPQRNGVGAYYHDLERHLRGRVDRFEILSPQLVSGTWRGGWALPLPGDPSQCLCIPSLRGLGLALRRLRPDVVVVPTPGVYGLAGAYHARRHGARLVVGLHTWYEAVVTLYWNELASRLGAAGISLCNRWLFRHAERVLVNAPSGLTVARRMRAPRAMLLGTPLAPAFIEHSLPPPVASVRRVLFAGRLAAEKNVEAVLAAARALPGVEFRLAGDGPERARVQRAAAELDNVRELGWLGRERLRAAIDASDVVVLPSRVESFGTVALEAMARRRLAIVSARCGIAEWPDLAEAMRVLGDGESLAATIARLACLPRERCETLAERARRAALRHHRAACDRWLELLRGDPPRRS